MNKKKLSKIDVAFEKIALAIRTKKPNFKFEYELSINECKDIASLLKGTKYGFASVIYRVIHRNVNFKRYYSEHHLHCVKEREISLSVENLTDVLLKFGKDYSYACKSWRHNSPEYDILCREFRLKNSMSNRKKIYNLWRQIKLFTEGNFASDFESNADRNPEIRRLTIIDEEVDNFQFTNKTNEMETEKLKSTIETDMSGHLYSSTPKMTPLDGNTENSICDIFETVGGISPSRSASKNNYELGTSSDDSNKTDAIQYSSQSEIEIEKHKFIISPKSSLSSISNSLLSGNHGLEVSADSTSVPGTTSSKSEKSIKNNDDCHISPKSFDIPKEIMNLSSPCKSAKVLPENSKNILPPLNITRVISYKDCRFLEGTFIIDDFIWSLIYKNAKLNKKYYPYFIRNRISKYVNNVCIIVFKYVKYLKKDNSVNIFGLCKHNNYNCKRFKISLKNKKGYVYSSSLNYYHPRYLTNQVRGVERCITKQKIYSEKPLNFKKHTLLKAGKEILKKGKNLQDIKSDATVRKIKSEAMGILDRSKDDLWDLILMQADHPEYIKEISIPFNIKLYSEEQFQVLKSECSGAELPMIYFDATGGVIRNPMAKVKKNMKSKRIFLYTAVINLKKAKRIYPIFSMVSSTHDANSIFKILHDFRYFCEGRNCWPAFSGTVTDFSFANLHAICKSFNRCTLLQYLQKCYTLTENNKALNNECLIGVYLCCAHFMKMVSKDVDKLASSNEQKLYFKDLVASAVLINDINKFDTFVKNMYIVLKSENYNEEVENAQKQLSMGPVNDDILKYSGDTNKVIKTDDTNESLYKSSPFYKRFQAIVNTIIINNYGNVNNKYFNCEYFDLILNKYLPFCPLWSGLMLNGRGPVSNAAVENYFGQLKKNMLNSNDSIKCSHVIRKIREDVLSLKIESDLGIGKSRLTKTTDDPSDEKHSQETWAKKTKKINTHFDGRFLKKQKSPLCNQSVVYPEDDDEAIQCAYCSHGVLALPTTSWVQCDGCRRWVHQMCDNPGGEKKTYVDDFICKMCTLTVTRSETLDHSKNRYVEFEDYLKSLKMSDLEMNELERNTRSQRLCEKWKEERKMRVTASNFGRICKVRQYSSFYNIVRDITEPRELNNIPILYGIRNEDIARKQYLRQATVEHFPAGLFIHRNHPFLAASPDGLLGKDGILEIKCPYTAKNADPSTYNFDFLNRDNSSLNTNHNYYYQIQGILEITDRIWCDLVIYTQKGIKVVKIFRSPRFWENMFKKLKVFYYFYMLPQIVFPGESLSEPELKWTTLEDMSFLENGLVANIGYYKQLKNKRGYVVTTNPDIKFTIQDILIDDFSSLSDKQWISSFVVDHCIAILNSSHEKYQIISVAKSSIIFDEKEDLTDAFTNGIKFTKDYVIMPVAKHNHYLLVVINFLEKKLTLIDPMGNELLMKNICINNFLRLLTKKNLNAKNWTFEVLDHVLQEDGYNCGVYVIYYFSKLVENKNLTDTDGDINSYRSELKWLLLKNSSDMKSRCLFCSQNVDETEVTTFKCRSCFRYIHEKCLLTVNELENKMQIEDKMINGLCDLCRVN